MSDADPMADIGARLKSERERLGLTQVALAARTEVTKATQIKYEAGQTMPNAAYLRTLSELGGDVLFIVTGTRLPTATTTAAVTATAAVIAPDEAALLDNYRHSDEEGRAAARRVLSSLAQPGQKAA